MKHGASLDDFNFDKYKSPPVGTPKPRNPNSESAIYLGNTVVNVTNTGRSGFGPPTAQPFHWAAMAGDLALLKYLYEEKMTPKEKKNIGANDLRAAAATRKIEAVDYILHLGVDINTPSEGRSGLLSSAIANWDFDMAQFLIAKGVHVNQDSATDQIPIIEASRQIDQTHYAIYVPKRQLTLR